MLSKHFVSFSSISKQKFCYKKMFLVFIISMYVMTQHTLSPYTLENTLKTQ